MSLLEGKVRTAAEPALNTLKNPAGLKLAHRLVDWSDILIENTRPGAMVRLVSITKRSANEDLN